MITHLDRFPLVCLTRRQAGQPRSQGLLPIVQTRQLGGEPLRLRCECRPVRSRQRKGELPFLVL